MKKPRIISETVLNRQRQASDPEVSAWVSANAGSGKTHVLAQRVIRLLLSGVDPARILCITFTKAAAGTMANRVFDELRRWTALDDGKLIEAMKNVGARDVGETARARARRLFALALETPGGLKVQTIHAFCTHILHLFPFEANVAARFTVLDEAEERQFIERAINEVLIAAAANPGSDTGRALAYAITAVTDGTFRDLIGKAIEERDAVEAWLSAAGSITAARAQLSRELNVGMDESEETIAADFLSKSLIARSEWSVIAAVGASGSKNDSDQSDRFRSLPTLSGARQIDNYIDIFCSGRGPRARIFTNAIKVIHGPLCERLNAERDRVWALVLRRSAAAARDRTIALITIAKAVLDRYRAEKDRRGLLDFEDQIDKTYALLSDERATWVQYKLDSGIEHMLIDEAQDTSPKQWGIVRRLVAEFFAGQGASEKKRTIFAVGDEKQSIFSFQGAAPMEFENMRREFEGLVRRSEQEFRHLRFLTSLRSGDSVLSAVDAAFKPAELALSLTRDSVGIPEHIALASAAPGEVEIWDTEKPAIDGAEKDPWNAPFDNLSGAKPVVRLAERIARTIRGYMNGGTRPGSVLVLVNRRGALFEAIIRALKHADIPVAGADRLVLTEHIAVMDLLVLADALLLPQDDLALATVLKCPLLGLDEDDLFSLAYDRGVMSLRASLERKSADSAKFASALARLNELAARAQTATPFAFYAHLLGAERGRERFLKRLGHEAADTLDEFLNLALDYERSEAPSLQGFVAWLRAAKSEIKRDMEMLRDEVRVMTTHGAKGLEAPIVILADTTARPEGYHPPPLLPLPASNGHGSLIWARKKEEDVGPMSAAREAARIGNRDEHRRLLYVAMTRAAERLIVCGVEGSTRPEGCWYDLVLRGLQGQPGFQECDEDGCKLWRYRKTDALQDIDTGSAEPQPRVAIPPWLKAPLASEPKARMLTPSGFNEKLAESAHGSAANSKKARDRGIALHRLIQTLPDIAPERRAAAAHALLARDKTLDAAERAELTAQVLRLLNDERFSPLFLPGSRAEVSIAGELTIGGEIRTVAGQIDRLVVTAEHVLIGDYKTNRPAPLRIADVPFGYLRQLALYRALLQKIYPKKPVRAALIWTEAPDLMELSSEVMDRSLTQVTSA